MGIGSWSQLSGRQEVGVIGLASAVPVFFVGRLVGVTEGHSFLGDIAGEVISLVSMAVLALNQVGMLLRCKRGSR